MRTSDEGIAFIKSYESLRLTPYQDAGGKWTIGYGHEIRSDEDYDTITAEQANAIFLADLSLKAEEPVNYAVQVSLKQCEFDALASLCYNIGEGNFMSSTLVRLLNNGNTPGAGKQFLRWDQVNGQVSNGLLARREAEQSIFLSGNYINHT